MNHRNEENGHNSIRPTSQQPVVDTPTLSQISCLSDAGDNREEKTITDKPQGEETDFVKLCKEGGHKGLLQIEEQDSRSSKPVPYQRKGGDWYYQDEQGDYATTRSNIRETDSEFVKLSKQGGHEGLLRIDSEGKKENPFVNSHGRYVRREERMSPSNCPPAGMKHAEANIVPGNPIWLGGSGPEKGFVPGKRFMKQTCKESPFAVSDDWMGTQPRNPDKI